MAPIRITTLGAGTLSRPELAPFVGKVVEIRVREASDFDDVADHEYHAELEAEAVADDSPVPSLEEVRTMLTQIPGNLSADIIADRDER